MKETLLNKQDVLNIVFDGLSKTIGERLGSYNSPLNNIVDGVIEEHADEIRTICREALKTVVKDKKFKDGVKFEFQRKVAKSMVGKLEGSVEKAVGVLRQNPQLKAEMILAIEKIINENQS